MNEIDEVRFKVRKLQELLYSDNINIEKLFLITTEIDRLLDNASINYNKYLNEKKII